MLIDQLPTVSLFLETRIVRKRDYRPKTYHKINSVCDAAGNTP